MVNQFLFKRNRLRLIIDFIAYIVTTLIFLILGISSIIFYWHGETILFNPLFFSSLALICIMLLINERKETWPIIRTKTNSVLITGDNEIITFYDGIIPHSILIESIKSFKIKKQRRTTYLLTELKGDADKGIYKLKYHQLLKKEANKNQIIIELGYSEKSPENMLLFLNDHIMKNTANKV